MEEFEYTFSNGIHFRIVLGEDGYNVNIFGLEKPLIGTFNSFEKLLKGIGDIVLINPSTEIDDFIQALDLSFSNTLVIDEIRQLLEE